MSSIKHEMLHGVFWSAIEKYSGLVVSLVVSMILARLLSPDEYGVVAIATVFTQFLSMFCTMGIAPAIIHRDDLDERDLDSIYTFSLIIGGFLSVLFFVLSWPISYLYENGQLTSVCQILSIQLFFSAANMVPNALMNKNRRFKEIAKRTLLLQLNSCTLAIVAAFGGMGVYSLLISPVLTSIGIFLFNKKYYKVHVCKNITFEPLKKVFSFAAYEFLFEFVNYFSRNLDKLIIGKYMSVAELGYYEKSYRLMQLPMNNVTAVVNPILQPVLSNLKEDPRNIAIEYNKIVRLLSTISFPLGVMLSLCATELIRIFYGDNWDLAIPTFSILSLSLPLQMIQSTSGSIFLAAGDAKGQFWVGIRNTLTTVSGFFIAAMVYGTIESMAWAWNITLFVNFGLTYFTLYHRTLNYNFGCFLKELFNPLILSLILSLFLFILNIQIQIPLLWSAVVKIGVSFLISVLYIQLTGRYNLLKSITRKNN